MMGNEKRPVRPFYFGVALLVALGALTLGYIGASVSLNDSLEEQHLVGGEPRSTSVDPVSSAESTPTLREIENQTKDDTHFARRLVLHNLLVDADVKELDRYFSQSKSLVSANFLREAQVKIIQRWSVLDPPRALNLVMEELPVDRRTLLLPLVFREWSHKHLTDAIKHAQRFEQDLLDVIVDSMVISREDLPTAERRKIARQLGHEWRAIEILSQEMTDPVIEAPAQEWTAFMQDHQNDLVNLNEEQLRMMGYVAYSWVIYEGVEVMARVREELPRAISLLETTEFIARELMETQPEIALELVAFVANQDHHLGYQDLAMELIGSWAGSDLKHALDATISIKAQSLRWELQKRALEAAAQADVDALLNSLDSLPEHLRVRAHALALVEIAKESPESVAEKLNDVSTLQERKLVAEAIVKGWARKDTADVIRWIDTTPRLPISRHKLKESMFQDLVDFDLQLAFETALSLPLNSEGAGWEGIVVEWVANRNSDLAESLLLQVRPGPGRIKAFDGVIFNSLQDHDYQRALNIFLQLCELEEHSDQSIWLMPLTLTAPDLVFASIDEITSSRARIEVAEWLHYRFADHNVFTKEELKRMQQIANSEKN